MPPNSQEEMLHSLAEKFDRNPSLFDDWKERHPDHQGRVSRAAFRRLMRSLLQGGEIEDINSFFDLLDPIGDGFVQFTKLEASLRWVIKSRRTTLVRGKEMVCRSEKQFHEVSPVR